MQRLTARLGWALALMCALGSLESAAHAQRLVIGDVQGGGDEAGAATLLFRSMFRSGQRPSVSRDELTRALARNPAARVGTLGVDPAKADPLLKDVGADRLLVVEVTRGLKTSISAKLFGPGNQILAAHTVQSAGMDLVQLALEAGRRIGKENGLEPATIDASFGELRPFARAAHLLDTGDRKGAAQALQIVVGDTAQRVPAAKEIADALWRDETLATDVRMVAAMAAGEKQEALKLGRADTHKSPETKAEEARVDLSLGDTKSAAKLLGSGKGAPGGDAMQLARAELALSKHKPGDDIPELDGLLEKNDPAALAVVARQPPGTLDPRTEALALIAAHRAGNTAPGVGSMIGVRAAKGGNKTADAVGLVKPDEMKPMELDDVDKMLEAGSSTPPDQLKALNAAAEGRRKPDLDDLDGSRPPVVKTHDIPPIDEQAQRVANALASAVAALHVLHHDGTMSIYPIQPAPTSLCSPLWPRTQAVAPALEHVLVSPPYDLDVARSPTVLEDLPDEAALVALAGSGPNAIDYVLFYRCRLVGTRIEVALSMYDSSERKVAESVGSIDGFSTRTVWPSPIYIGVVAALVLAGVMLAVLVVLSIGEVNVRVKADPAAENETFGVIITKQARPPSIENPQEWHENGRIGKRTKTRLHHLNAEAMSTFPRVPVGAWWVHVYGTNELGGELRMLRPGLTQRITVARKSVQTVKFDLAPDRAEFKVAVTDTEPVEGATLTYDDKSAPPVVTDKEGKAILFLPLGRREVHLVARDVEVTRGIDVSSTKPQVLSFDLVRERLKAGVALSEDEQAGRRAYAPKPASQPSLDVATPKAPPEPEDDGISLPDGFGQRPHNT